MIKFVRFFRFRLIWLIWTMEWVFCDYLLLTLLKTRNLKDELIKGVKNDIILAIKRLKDEKIMLLNILYFFGFSIIPTGPIWFFIINHVEKDRVSVFVPLWSIQSRQRVRAQGIGCLWRYLHTLIATLLRVGFLCWILKLLRRRKRWEW